MAAEDILEALAAKQALDSTPEPWLEAARGAISTEEAAQRVRGQEEPELVERSRQLFAPGDAAADERRLEQLLRDGFEPPQRAWARPLAIALALAAALVLVLALPWSGGTGSPLASYSLELDQGARMDRAAEPSAPTDVVRFYADRSFRATLRPWTAVETEVEAAVYACEAAGPRRLPVVPRVLPSGVVVVEGDVAALGLAVGGTWELLFVVGAAGAVPEPRTCETQELSDADDVRVLRQRIEILPPPR